MRFLIILFLFSSAAMANKIAIKHYKLTAEETDTKWRYFYKQKFNLGTKSEGIVIEKCYAMHIDNGEKIEIPCTEMDKIKSTLDLREVDVTQRSASAI